MSDLEDIKSSFARKLDARAAQHADRLEADLQDLRTILLSQVKPALPDDLACRMQGLAAPPPAGGPPVTGMPSPQVQGRVDFGGFAALRDLDESFKQLFRLSRYYSAYRLNYPTVYCETLEEFFGSFVDDLDVSPQARQTELERLVAEAQERAARSQGGGTFGVYFPGRGCFMNGWLFVYGEQISPRQALGTPELMRSILETAAHEKLGHGFLGAYSALGAVKTQLGLQKVELALKFGLRPADDPVSRLRSDQSQLLFYVSQLLEEGWATWIETYLAQSVLGSGTHPRHKPQAVLAAVQSLPLELNHRQEIQGVLMAALTALFGDEDLPLDVIHEAAMAVEKLGIALEEHFQSKLGQPLRYAVGELLFVQAATQQGPLCAPYSGLIAANVTFEPDKIGLGDLEDLLFREPRLHPDTRLAAISRLRLEQPGDVAELARRAEAEFSFSVPREMKL